MPLGFQWYPNIAGPLQAGAIPLAVAGDKRIPALPDTPTTTEAGLPEYKVNGWFALLAPGGTPRPILEKLNKELTAALNDPRSGGFEKAGAETIAMPLDEAKKFHASEIEVRRHHHQGRHCQDRVGLTMGRIAAGESDHPERVLIAGAGPVGLVAAANLVRRGIPVTVFEAGRRLSEESRASTFHPPTLDMLDVAGRGRAAAGTGAGCAAVSVPHQEDGLLAEFDFGLIADVTGFPYRVQCEQSKLTRILYERLRTLPDFALEFGCEVQGVEQNPPGVDVVIARGGTETRSGRWLIGADGARSDVRRSLGIEFEGFTWPERFLVVSTPFDFQRDSRCRRSATWPIRNAGISCCTGASPGSSTASGWCFRSRRPAGRGARGWRPRGPAGRPGGEEHHSRRRQRDRGRGAPRRGAGAGHRRHRGVDAAGGRRRAAGRLVSDPKQSPGSPCATP